MKTIIYHINDFFFDVGDGESADWISAGIFYGAITFFTSVAVTFLILLILF